MAKLCEQGLDDMTTRTFMKPSVKTLKPMLPQQDAAPEARRRDLEYEQQRFQYAPFPEFLQDTKKFGNTFKDVRFPILREPPAEIRFSGEYLLERVAKTAPLLTNQALMRARGFFDPLDDLEDFDDCFTRLPVPPVAKSYQEDDAFAEQRISGVNPFTLTHLEKNDPRAKVLERITNSEQLQKAKAALDSGRCFVADYTGTDPAYVGPSLIMVRSCILLQCSIGVYADCHAQFAE
jgi:arachidonate 15-lipoxygenase